jgi:hypothetical protein
MDFRTVARQSVLGREAIFRYFLNKIGENFRVVAFDFGTETSVPLKALRSVFPGLPDDELRNRFTLLSVPFDDSHNDWRFLTYDYTCRNIMELIRQNPGVKAFAFTNDDFALGAAAGINQAGLTVGKDILIAGFNNNIETARYPLPVSSVEFNIPRAAELLIQEMTRTEPCTVECGLRLVIREWDADGRIIEKYQEYPGTVPHPDIQLQHEVSS